jgi:glycerol-3-phosphate O-acyltransferase / dihydroxyacetone phosphate acyltransferase
MGQARTPFSYRALQLWAGTAVHVVYRRVEVTGLENLPTDRPAILAANHTNALADIAVIVAEMPNFPRFLAAASWWKSAPARVLFRLGGVVPIYRSRDGNDTRQNLSTFEACNDVLASGAHICIFPEGEMHTESALMPLKTGAARIALGAAADAGVRGVTIVPVGIVYEDRGRFRSDVEIRFGDPIDIDDWTDRTRIDPRKTAREITDLLAHRLALVTVNHGSPAEAKLIDRAAAITISDTTDASFARRNELRRVLASAVAPTTGETGAAPDLAATVETYDAELTQLGVSPTRRPRNVSEPSGAERARLARELALLGPPAVVGLLANAPVVAGAALASSRAKHESWKATTKGVAGTFLCPIVWGTEYAFLARRMGRSRAFALTAAGALSGVAALAWYERFERRREILWLDRTDRRQPQTLAAARASRELLRERVAALAGQPIA